MFVSGRQNRKVFRRRSRGWRDELIPAKGGPKGEPVSTAQLQPCGRQAPGLIFLYDRFWQTDFLESGL